MLFFNDIFYYICIFLKKVLFKNVTDINFFHIKHQIIMKKFLHSSGKWVLTVLSFLFVILTTINQGQAQNPVASDDCSTAPMICNLDGYTGNTSSSYTPDCSTCASSGGDYSNMCQSCSEFDGIINNNSWITFTAEATIATLKFDVTNCVNHQGIQFGIYSGSNCDNFHLLTDIAFTSPTQGLGEGAFTITANPLTVGNVYYIMVDGYAGDVCDYEISVIDGIATGTVTGTASVCAGLSGVTYHISTNATGYVWTVPAGATITAGQGTNTITVNWGTASSGDVICQTSAGACPGILRNFPVTVNPIPVAEAGVAPSQITCTSTSMVLTGSGGGTYSWSASNGGHIVSGANTATPTIDAAGTYTLTVTTNGCSASDNVVVTQSIVLPTAEAGASPGTITCANTSMVLSGSGGGTYSWSASNGGHIVSGANTSTPTIDAGGTYTLTVTQGTCTATDNVVVSQNTTPPAADAGTAPGTLTCTVTSLQLTGSGGGTYSWTASNGGNIVSGANTATPTIDAAGTYNVVVTGGNGCTASDFVVITLDNTPPPAEAGMAPGIITCSTTTLVLSGSGGGTYSWSASNGGHIVSGAATANPTIDAGGTYTLTVTNGTCTATDDIVISQNTTPPTANAGIDTNICPGTSTILNASGGVIYLWSPSATLDDPNLQSPTATPALVTTYSVIVTGTNGCTATDTVMIGFYQTVTPVINPSGLTGFCDSSSVDVSLDAGAGYTTYNWSNGETTQVIDVTFPGTYVVTVVDNHSCSILSSGAVVYVEAPMIPPVIIAEGPSTFCEGDSVYLHTTVPYYTYLWSSGSTTSYIDVYETNNYIVTVTDSLGCKAVSAPYHVQVNPNPVAFASYSNNMLDVSFFDFSINATDWNWDFGDGQSSLLSDPTHLYDSADVYMVIFTATNACGSDNDTLYIDLPGPAGFNDYNEIISEFLLFPVPAENNLFISFMMNKSINLELSIIDVIGREIISERIEKSTGKYIKSYDLSEISGGLYFIYLKSDDIISVQKFIKK